MHENVDPWHAKSSLIQGKSRMGQNKQVYMLWFGE